MYVSHPFEIYSRLAKHFEQKVLEEISAAAGQIIDFLATPERKSASRLKQQAPEIRIMFTFQM